MSSWTSDPQPPGQGARAGSTVARPPAGAGRPGTPPRPVAAEPPPARPRAVTRDAPPRRGPDADVTQQLPVGAAPMRIRRARLKIARVDPWSVMKISFLLFIAAGIVVVVATAVLWSVIDALGVFSTVGTTVRDVTGSSPNTGFDLQSYLSLSRVVGFVTLVSLVNVVLGTALATLGSFLYNLAASFVGGLEVTLSDSD